MLVLSCLKIAHVYGTSVLFSLQDALYVLGIDFVRGTVQMHLVRVCCYGCFSRPDLSEHVIYVLCVFLFGRAKASET